MSGRHGERERGAIPRGAAHGGAVRHRARGPGRVIESRQVPTIALTVEATIVEWSTHRVGDALATLVALDLPGQRQAHRATARVRRADADQAAALLVGIVDAAVLVVRVVAHH